MDKICIRCKLKKQLEAFNKCSAATDGRDNRCKSCTRERDKQRYWSDVEGQRSRARKKNQEICERNSLYIQKYLSQHSCCDCGESDIIVLEFDHVKPGKHKNISDMIPRSSLIKLKEEIEKCDIRCANCHRRKTARDFWTKTGRIESSSNKY